MIKIYVKFPSFGLGNKLLLFAQAFSFAQKNNAEIYVGRWWHVSWGAILRRERSKRFYYRLFINEPIGRKIDLFFIKKSIGKVSIDRYDEWLNNKKQLLVFDRLILKDDYFFESKPYRDSIKNKVFTIMTDKVRKRIEALDHPVIGVHIRRGDFKINSTITPISFFVEGIRTLRSITNQTLSVTIFSDADDLELTEILALENVKRSNNDTDLDDLIQLSYSKILLLSIGSTFSYFAAFISNSIVIKNIHDWQDDIRPKDINDKFFEGKVDFNMELPLVLVDQINKIRLS
jgi:hypothetical protein